MEAAAVSERIGLQAVLGMLDGSSKRILKKLRVTRLQDATLYADPLGWLVAEWRWEGIRDHLVDDLHRGRYRPSPASESLGAKSKGLNRAMSHLEFRDQVLLGAIVDATADTLFEKAQPWATAGRVDSEETKGKSSVAEEDDESDYSGVAKSWWVRWLEKENVVSEIVTNKKLLVESDISNFFPSVDLEVMRRKLLTDSLLDTDIVDLLLFLLQEVGPTQKLQRSVSTGLPVDEHDCSRTLAHFYLAEMDQEFDREGRAGVYGRFVDDVIFGVDSEVEAMKTLGRFQKSLDEIGLYPNSSKTRWFTPARYETEYCRSLNDNLEEINQTTKSDTVLAHHQLDEFTGELLAAERNRRGWARVLRRTATSSRKLRSQTLLAAVPELLWAQPGAARHLAEYAISWRIDQDLFHALISEFHKYQGVYPEVDALFFEILGLGVVDNSIRNHVVDLAITTLKSRLSHEPVAASAAAVIGKLGRHEDIETVALWSQPVLRSAGIGLGERTAWCVMRCRLGNVSHLPDAAHDEGIRSAAAFIDAVEASEEKAVRLAIQRARQREKREPDRLISPARATLLIHALKRSGQQTFQQLARSEHKRFVHNEIYYRDPALARIYEWDDQLNS